MSYFPDFDGMHVALRTGVHGSGRIGDSEKGSTNCGIPSEKTFPAIASI